MSKLSDYSKFDHLDTDSDDDDDDEGRQQETSSTTAAVTAQVSSSSSCNQNGATNVVGGGGGGGIFTRDKDHANRFVYEYPQGNPIYSWEQSLDSVTLFIPTPPNVVTRASQLDCRIQPNRLQVGLRIPNSVMMADGNNNNNNEGPSPFFLDEPTAGTVDIHNSTWTWENNVMTLELFKANKGVVWRAVTLGCQNNNSDSATTTTTAAQLDPFQLEQEQKRLLLERWQEENPGMDFRDAEFNGSAPDPRTFMGGVRYD